MDRCLDATLCPTSPQLASPSPSVNLRRASVLLKILTVISSVGETKIRPSFSSALTTTPIEILEKNRKILAGEKVQGAEIVMGGGDSG